MLSSQKDLKLKLRKTVFLLRKALYGLKQAPRQWFEKISGYLISIGFQVSPADSSLFVRKSAHGMIVLVLYVDDLILTGYC